MVEVSLWSRNREKFRDELNLINVNELPPITKQLGVCVRGNTEENLSWVHRMMIHVFQMKCTTVL